MHPKTTAFPLESAFSFHKAQAGPELFLDCAASNLLEENALFIDNLVLSSRVTLGCTELCEGLAGLCCAAMLARLWLQGHSVRVALPGRRRGAHLRDEGLSLRRGAFLLCRPLRYGTALYTVLVHKLVQIVSPPSSKRHPVRNNDLDVSKCLP